MERPIKKICDLKPGDKGFNVTVQIKTREEAREITIKKTQEKKFVANAVVGDDTGEIAMTLWGEDAMTIKQGEWIKIENGLVGDWMDKIEITAGKFGKIIKLNE